MGEEGISNEKEFFLRKTARRALKFTEPDAQHYCVLCVTN